MAELGTEAFLCFCLLKGERNLVVINCSCSCLRWGAKNRPNYWASTHTNQSRNVHILGRLQLQRRIVGVAVDAVWTVALVVVIYLITVCAISVAVIVDRGQWQLLLLFVGDLRAPLGGRRFVRMLLLLLLRRRRRQLLAQLTSAARLLLLLLRLFNLFDRIVRKLLLVAH